MTVDNRAFLSAPSDTVGIRLGFHRSLVRIFPILSTDNVNVRAIARGTFVFVSVSRQADVYDAYEIPYVGTPTYKPPTHAVRAQRRIAVPLDSCHLPRGPDKTRGDFAGDSCATGGGTRIRRPPVKDSFVAYRAQAEVTLAGRRDLIAERRHGARGRPGTPRQLISKLILARAMRRLRAFVRSLCVRFSRISLILSLCWASSGEVMLRWYKGIDRPCIL